ncbi:Ectonucleoside triphosphate diphosphohydrolase 4 [Cichlidogyrus casuarinus]|uniref:Ectonucleoside triphosphate diphosphohydrolase 4 n=1 Tax=Cichlidogyrus casuarinus TaxID=1844966 RepID=A0ABD2PR77_9PLAT
MFLYTWPDRGQAIPEISIMLDSTGKQVVKKQTPGLSSYAERLSEIPQYLGPLLDLASTNIPAQLHSTTSVFILATAGMRFLSESDQNDIWTRVRQFVASSYSFSFLPEMAFTISGPEEGIYGWITVNYLLGRFTHSSAKPTVGMIDLGGGSMQIAYQIPYQEDHENIFNVDLSGDKQFTLYATTFLGYGINAAKSLYKGMLASNLTNKAKSVVKAEDVSEYSEFINRELAPLREGTELKLRGTGEVPLCSKKLKPLLRKGVACSLDPCSMKGVHQPSLPAVEFYGLSEFWYTASALDADRYEKRAFIERGLHYCQMPSSNRKEQEWKNSRCFNAAWISLVLHEGFGFPDSLNNFYPVNEINGIEVQWSLGALLFKFHDSFNRYVSTLQ